VVYKNCKVFIDGFDLSGDHNTIGLDYSAESLDATTFGSGTRIHKGGLKDVRLTGHGFVQYGANLVDPALFAIVGTDDEVVSLYPDGITENSTGGAGRGYAFKAVETAYTVGAAVGELLAFDMTAEGRGVAA